MGGPVEGVGRDEAGVVEPLGVMATEGAQVADLKGQHIVGNTVEDVLGMVGATWVKIGLFF